MILSMIESRQQLKGSDRGNLGKFIEESKKCSIEMKSGSTTIEVATTQNGRHVRRFDSRGTFREHFARRGSDKSPLSLLLLQFSPVGLQSGQWKIEIQASSSL